MKKLILLSALFLIYITNNAQTSTFTTNNNKILDPCGQDFIPRGLNYSLADDWNFPGNLNDGRERSVEIIQANPNTVRIQWYVNYGNANRPPLTLEGLDSVITRFARANVVSILELHDFTHIHTDTLAFNNQIIAWWTDATVLQLIEKHKQHLFVNIANEYGPALYPAPNYTLNPNYATEVNNWVIHNKNCISYLRNAGITAPIIIDAPNYGMDYQTVIDRGAEFNTHDPLNRIIMSCHAYWNENTAGMENIVNQLSAMSFPVIFGEVGNVDFSCNAIEMNAFLNATQNKNMGWLAWTWNRDECAVRNMTANEPGNPNSSTDGKYASLTSYGQQIVNNTTYGLALKAIKPNPNCMVGIADVQDNILLKTYPNPVSSEINLKMNTHNSLATINIIDISGKIVESIQSTESEIQLSTISWESGIYFIQINFNEQSFSDKYIVLKK